MRPTTPIRAILLGGSALALAAASPSMAADASSGAAAASSEATTVGEVIITARKREERLLDVPVSANAISGATLQNNAISDMTQVGLTVPQVSIDKAPSGNGAIITIRGIGSSSVDGSIEQEVTVNIDGVPTSRGRILYQSSFDESSVEILKGPQALYFGKNSPAGVISVNSANPSQEFGGYATVGGEAESQTYFGEFAISGPITDTLSARFAFRGSDMVDGFIKDVGGPITNPAQLPVVLALTGVSLPGARYGTRPAESDETGRLTLLWKPDSKFDANFKFLLGNYQNNGSSGETIDVSCHNGNHTGSTDLATGAYLVDPYSVCGHHAENSSGTIPASIAANYPGSHGGVPYEETVTILSSLTLDYHLTDDFLLTSVTGFYKSSDIGWDNFDYTDFAIASGENDEYNTTWTQEIRGQSSFKGPVNFTAGFFYENDERRFIQNGMIGYLGLAANGQSNTFGSTQYFGGDTYSGFAEVNIKPLQNLEIAGGARYTVEEKSGNVGTTYEIIPLTTPVGERIIGAFTEHNVSPQVTVSYHLSSNIMAYGAYKTGFKSGGFSSPALIPATATAQNQEFGQEKVSGGEVGLKFSNVTTLSSLGRLSGDISLYDYTYTGLQLTAFEPPAEYYTQNAGNATTEGVEVNLNQKINREFSVHGSMGYNHARYNSFPDSECWTGQTVAEGCVNEVVNGAVAQVQNLGGKPLARAPDWTSQIGVNYDVPVHNDWSLGVLVNGRYSSGYYTGTNNNPYGWQNQYEALDATLRLYNDKWDISLVGRNLTDSIYYLLSSDKPLGLRGDVAGTIGRPREVIIQATRRF